jgi:hypothetical protein
MPTKEAEAYVKEKYLGIHVNTKEYDEDALEKEILGLQKKLRELCIEQRKRSSLAGSEKITFGDDWEKQLKLTYPEFSNLFYTGGAAGLKLETHNAPLIWVYNGLNPFYKTDFIYAYSFQFTPKGAYKFTNITDALPRVSLSEETQNSGHLLVTNLNRLGDSPVSRLEMCYPETFGATRTTGTELSKLRLLDRSSHPHAADKQPTFSDICVGSNEFLNSLVGIRYGAKLSDTMMGFKNSIKMALRWMNTYNCNDSYNNSAVSGTRDMTKSCSMVISNAMIRIKRQEESLLPKLIAQKTADLCREIQQFKPGEITTQPTNQIDHIQPMLDTLITAPIRRCTTDSTPLDVATNLVAYSVARVLKFLTSDVEYQESMIAYAAELIFNNSIDADMGVTQETAQDIARLATKVICFRTLYAYLLAADIEQGHMNILVKKASLPLLVNDLILRWSHEDCLSEEAYLKFAVNAIPQMKAKVTNNPKEVVTEYDAMLDNLFRILNSDATSVSSGAYLALLKEQYNK